MATRPRRRRPLHLPASLRWRLTLFVATVMLATAGLAFVVIYFKTGTQLQGQTDRDLRGDVSQLVQSLRWVQKMPTARAYGAAERYIAAQPYSATSTLLFVRITGEPPIGSFPGVFRTSPAPRARVGFSSQQVPGVGKLRILERGVTLGGRPALVGAGEPLALIDRAQHGIARAFVLVAALSLLLALAASYFAGQRVTAPLRRMAGIAARVDAGDLEPRMEEDTLRGEEVRVLADAFNHMLDRLTEAFEAQRGFIANASHELRTPLTVIRGQLEVLAAVDDPPVEEVQRVERVVQAEISRMTRLVDDLMLLTAAGQSGFLRPEEFELGNFVNELWDGLELTEPRRFELGPVPDGRLNADPDRLAQALRNLARNAIEQTEPGAGLVRLEVDALGGGRIRFAVLDNGPGIPPEDRERVFDRLYRVNPARSRGDGGAGLGLAIVRAIAEAHGGSAHVADPDGFGGARVELVLDNFHRA